jgi:C-terminal processing protease CtpA/Prc
VPRLEKAKGIIFDMRGYPGQPGIQALAHLTDNVIRSAKWNIPQPSMPDRLDFPFVESGWPVQPAKPYFTARRVFLTDGRAISYAETVMGIVEYFKLGEIVGGPTAGTNGNVNPFRLPGGYTIAWTGMKVLKHDGSQHHGIGILPTVPASRTRKGVSEGKDEILLRGLEVVRMGQ